MRFLFVKPSQSWPRSSGHDVHGYHMMRALGELGHEVALATIERPTAEALDGLELCGVEVLDDHLNGSSPPIRLTRWQERFRSYWGVDRERVAAVGRLCNKYDADVVVVVGLEVLPLLGAVDGAQRVWYAADEWVWHHLSVFRLTDRSTWSHLRTAAIKGAYEFAYRDLVDRAWVVSPADQRAMRWLAGLRQVDVIPNGVDTDYFAPLDVKTIPNSCVFWGRLDFEPNIQALQWFCQKVWPQLQLMTPGARFRIFGFAPGREMEQLAGLPGVEIVGDLPDLREEISRSEVVVLPFQSGGGVKNKLLEAAGMARPLVCSQRACNGLALPEKPPLVMAGAPQAWVREIRRLWSATAARLELGEAARQWVTESHSWVRSAELALGNLQPSAYLAKRLTAAV